MHPVRPESRDDAHAVFDAVRRIVQALRRSSRSAEKELGVSSAQLFVLQKIAESESPPSINTLADATLTHQSSVSAVVSKLVLRKLVRRVRSASDSRAVELQLTGRGSTLLGDVAPSVQERLMEAVARMSLAERRGLVRGLQSLVRQAGLQEEEPSLFFEDGKGKKT